MKKFKSVDELISQLQPDKPVYCIRKNLYKTQQNSFKTNFQENTLCCENKSK